jgi:3-(methylthio)propanoyl-CoA dehydrogenase
VTNNNLFINVLAFKKVFGRIDLSCTQSSIGTADSMHNIDVIARHITLAHGFEAVTALGHGFAEATPELIDQVLSSVSAYADEHLVGLNRTADKEGVSIVDGRVVTPDCHVPAWNTFVSDGWLSIDAPIEMGGMGLPNALAAAVQEVCDQSCPSFGMMPVPMRSGARLLHALADPETLAEWLPRLISGEWGATICISEADAGSDVRQIRTRAIPTPDGTWQITGEKCWISFGDQQLTQRIGHFLLAQTDAGLSLFLVPNWFSDPAQSNGITVRRVEEKLGLHLSPTCSLGFEGARGILIGKAGRGLPQMFVMITNMRLATGVQGAGIAASAYAAARAYAEERRQGGTGAQPVPIAQHADIQATLLRMAARLETLRGLNFAVANHADLMRSSPDAATREFAAALNGWLLPIIKTLGGETAFDVSNDAIQIFGGAGYTREWPVEQYLRDARVLTIFEGTTGMQAQDLLFRRLLKGEGSGYRAFLEASCDEARTTPEFAEGLSNLERAVQSIIAESNTQLELETVATQFLHLAMLVAQGWIAARLARASPIDHVSRHLAAAGRFFLDELPARSRMAADLARPSSISLIAFGDLM